ncbi:MAG: acetyl/propionyl/methylcrotonyl-CoA carboxylase subunit alpha [Kineosporiaceae bacterium]
MRRVLVANRGEIAVRIVRACHDLGLEAYVAHSLPDRDDLACTIADGTVCLGPGEAAASYRNVPAVLYAAARVGADAVHPGYGFLAEDPAFARACADVGLTFVGPSAEVIALMGDKIAGRARMREAGVPVLPGSVGAVAELGQARAVADEIGYPVILKAAAGGGGRGIAVVHHHADLPEAWQRVAAAAASLFGDPRVFVERFVAGGRHVEVQVLGDGRDVVLLGERDCSVQRRNQKIVEECPAPALPRETTDVLREAVARGGRTLGYSGAGTFEFIVEDSSRPYFMEMNTRLQVEHTVTEEVFGLDIVTAMLRIAAGGTVPEPPRPSGWAIEARVVAEDPARGWLPSAGRLGEVHLPAGPGVRVDSHLRGGAMVSPLYDSLLAKVVARGCDRDQARARLHRALRELRVDGVATNRDVLLRVLDHPSFAAGHYTVDLLDQVGTEPLPSPTGGTGVLVSAQRGTHDG